MNSKFKTQCAYCGKDIEFSETDYEKNEIPEPICDECRKLVEAGKEDEING
ncbi:hypothetical protein [Alkalicoccus luteus]|uniref:Uncharacterized protein n=1 Tax=Alkalicoccus luteus TaxID=1237094 RepID=A0A969PT76_9BACI|nr:hypothetical protein [Alkalicoccus luteus]NJP37936.1 hypothetical protein [Alkalicoccus luteus]